MPEGDAQKKEIDQANRPLENLSQDEDAMNSGAKADAGTSGENASPDAQKKEAEQV